MKIIPINVVSDTLFIAALGDTHIGNEGFSGSALTSFIRAIKEDSRDHQLSCIGTGDYTDPFTPSNRTGYKQSGLYSSVMRRIQSKALMPLVNDFCAYLSPLKGHFAALVRGHHYWEFDYEPDLDPEKVTEEQGLKKGERPFRWSDDLIAHRLYAPLAAHHCIISYHFPSGRRYRVLVWHGEGSGQLLSHGLNKLARKSGGWEGIDCIVMGHNHILGSVAETRLRLSDDEDDVIARSIPLVNSGAFLKGYLVNDTTYVEEKGLNARALGGAMVRVRDEGGKSFRNRVSLYL